MKYILIWPILSKKVATQLLRVNLGLIHEWLHVIRGGVVQYGGNEAESPTVEQAE